MSAENTEQKAARINGEVKEVMDWMKRQEDKAIKTLYQKPYKPFFTGLLPEMMKTSNPCPPLSFKFLMIDMGKAPETFGIFIYGEPDAIVKRSIFTDADHAVTLLRQIDSAIGVRHVYEVKPVPNKLF